MPDDEDKPDFKAWADRILDRTELAEQLERAWETGYVVGVSDANKNWWQQQDKEVTSA